MTFLVERLAELRLYLDHARRIRTGLTAEQLATDLTLRNDVLFSLQTIAQLVIDISGELCARAGVRFDDYTSAVRGLTVAGPFPGELVDRLVRLPGFRNVVIHEYVMLDYDRVVSAIDELEPIDDFVALVAELESA